ncbi:MAG: DUF5666 domain-containing protein [Burkholderiaceae bacterium]
MFNRPTLSPRRLTAGVAQLFLVAAVLAGCGGGGSDSSSSDTATAYSSGPITGFGSVIVNGVRFDDSSARITDDDDVAVSRDDLRLGMTAEVQGAGVTTDSLGRHGRALAIRLGNEIVGPVSAVDATAKTLTALGQVVDVTDNTLFGERITGGLAGIAVGTVIEVNGALNVTTGHYTATRIDVRPNAPYFRVRGVIASLDTTAKTFRIGDALISYAGLASTDMFASLANGLLVRVRLQTTQVDGAWVAARIAGGVRKIENQDEAEIHGLITSFTSATQFSVNGIAVDATNATFPDGQAGVVLGARVEVEGKAVDGVIVARKVELQDERELHIRGFELHGSITTIDTTAKTFVLRGVTVNYANAVIYKDGTEADLKVGAQVEVKGMLNLDGKTLAAVRIEFGK